MVRVLHAGDFHLDSAFGALTPDQARQRRAESRGSVQRLVDWANDHDIQLMLLAGDLFDGAAIGGATARLLAAALGTLLCTALVKRRAGGGMLYTVRFPILVPHTVVALFIMTLLGQTGIVARAAYGLGLISDYTKFPQILFTPGYGGAIAGYLWKEIPFVAYYTLALMASVSNTLGEAAENLGASPLRSFFSVTLPMSLPAVSKAALIIFIYACGGYELPALLGSTLPKALPVQAYITYLSPDLLQRPLAMAMFGVILMLSVLMAALYSNGIRRSIKRLGREA